MSEHPFLHNCHCGKWGSFGYRVRLLKGQRGEWFCAEHRPAFALKLTKEEVSMPTNTPTRFQRRCELCTIELDTRAPGVHQWTAGWVMQREGGGGHGISLPERADRWAHRHCVEEKSRGLFGQSNLFGAR